MRTQRWKLAALVVTVLCATLGMVTGGAAGTTGLAQVTGNLDGPPFQCPFC